MKVKDVITRVRNMAGDTSALQFTDSMLVDWMNDGVRECVINNQLMQTRATITVASGTSKYAVPSNLLRLHSIKYNGSKLPVHTLQEFEQLNDIDESQTGKVELAYIWSGSINLAPSPDSDGASLVVDYLRAPDEVHEDAIETAVLPIPSEYHARIVDYCLAQVAQQDGDSNLYAIKMQEFKTGVQDLKHQAEIQDDVYPSISVSLRDMGDTGEYYG